MNSTIHSHLRPGTGVPSNAPGSPATHALPKNEDAEKQLGFADLIDIVNPLQHIPVVGQIYRSISGDTIHPMMKIAGGALFGGPLGALFSAAEVAFTTRDVEPVVPPGGVDPATVAGTYPFEETELDALNIHTNNPAAQQYAKLVSHFQYGDGIFNPAVTIPDKHSVTQSSEAKEIAKMETYSDGIPNPAGIHKQHVTQDLIALRQTQLQKPSTVTDPVWLQKAYQLKEASIDLQDASLQHRQENNAG